MQGKVWTDGAYLLHTCAIPECGVSDIGADDPLHEDAGVTAWAWHGRGLPDDSEQGHGGTGLAAGSAARAVNGQLAGIQH